MKQQPKLQQITADSLASLNAGIAINGRTASSQSGYQVQTQGVVNVGDVNGDGLNDILEKDGWWEQPASLAGDPVWKRHPFSFAAKGGAQMYVMDVNGDGVPDVITSKAAIRAA